MKRFTKIILVALCLVLVFFISLIFFVRSQGKAFIEKQASLMFQRPVTVDGVRFVFPMSVHLTDLNVQGLLFVPDAQVRCSPTEFFSGNFQLAEVSLDAPVLTLHRSRDNQIIWAEHYEADTKQTGFVPTGSVPINGGAIKAVIGRLKVADGQIYFPRHEDQGSFDVSVHDIALTAWNVPLSGQSVDVNFDFAGKIIADQLPLAGDLLKSKGTINWPKRNMDATVFFVNPQGNTDFEVSLNSRNNDMMVRGHLKTKSTAIKAGNQGDRPMENALLNAVQKTGMTLDLDFSFPMKMDQWELRNIDFSGNLSAPNGGKTGAQAVKK